MKGELWKRLSFSSLGDAIEAASVDMVTSFASEDFKEGVAHYLEKRRRPLPGSSPAGGGYRLPSAGTKNRCLTTWRRPIRESANRNRLSLSSNKESHPAGGRPPHRPGKRVAIISRLHRR